MAILSAFFSSSPSISATTHLQSLQFASLRAFPLPLRRCRSLQRPKKSRVLVCELTPEDGPQKNSEPEPELSAETIPSTDEHGGLLVTNGLITGLAAVGFVETAYLAFVKLSGGAVSCPLGGGTCNDVLNSEYATVFGVPLSAVGAFAYGTVAFLGLLAISKTSVNVAGIDITRWLLLGTTGAMASASTYFMYILSTKLEGASCAYCVTSALLSFSLLLLTLRVRGPPPSASLGTWIANRFSSKEVKQVAGVQLAVTASVIVALSSAYTGIAPALTGSADIDLPPVEPQVTTSSNTVNVSLAKHLHSIGAKMYGAFWCSHCFEQKQMFGREAVKYLDYVECYPEGYRRGVKIAKACDAAHIESFPTWIIRGEVLSGEQELSELARVAGFDASQ